MYYSYCLQLRGIYYYMSYLNQTKIEIQKVNFVDTIKQKNQCAMKKLLKIQFLYNIYRYNIICFDLHIRTIERTRRNVGIQTFITGLKQNK